MHAGSGLSEVSERGRGDPGAIRRRDGWPLGSEVSSQTYARRLASGAGINSASVAGAHLGDFGIDLLHEILVEVLGVPVDYRLDLLLDALDLRRGNVIDGDAVLFDRFQRLDGLFARYLPLIDGRFVGGFLDGGLLIL